MLIHGQEFDFSLLNANDLDRLEDALDEMTREGEAETARCERENVRLGDRLRAQARVSMRGLDKILGAGASARLGLNENDVSRLYDVLDEITQAAAAEKARYSRPAAAPHARTDIPFLRQFQAGLLSFCVYADTIRDISPLISVPNWRH